MVRMLVTGMLVILDMGSLFVEDTDGGTTMVICCLTAPVDSTPSLDPNRLVWGMQSAESKRFHDQ